MAEIANRSKVSWLSRIGWGFGGWADNYTFSVVGLLYMYIYVDYFKVNPILVGMAVAIPRFFDAITDPILGNWSDNFRSRWGRRRPLIVAGAILCGILLPLHWTPFALETANNPWYSNGPFIYFSLIGCIFAVAYTIFIVPYTALGFELTDDYDERTKVLVWRRYLGLCGSFFTPLVYTLSVNKELFSDIRTGAVVTSMVAGFAVMVLGTIPAFTCKENVQATRKQEKISMWVSFKSLIGNWPYMQQIIGFIIGDLTGGALASVQGLLILHYVCHGNETLNGDIQLWMGWLGSGISILSLVLFSGLSKKFGKREGLIISNFLVAAGYITLFFTMVPSYPYLLMTSFAMIWIASQGGGLMLDTMCSDICEYEEYRSGRRVEGMLSAFRSFVRKAVYALSGILGGVALVYCGYDANLIGTEATMSEEVFTKLKALFILVPFIGLLITNALYWFYPLTRKRMEEIHAELEKRHAEAGLTESEK